jgi:D-inositol-3-phosphate glycosyltransferase
MGNNLKIALFDPNSHGGICHYSFHLAEALANQGVDVTLFTSEENELAHLQRHFKFYFLFKRSWLKAVLNRRPAKKSTPNSGIATAGKTHRSLTNKGFLYATRRWSRLIKSLLLLLWRQPDVVHFQWLGEREQDWRFIRILRRLNFNVVYTAHNVLPHADQSAATKLFFNEFYQTVDRIIVHSESNKAEMLEQFPLDPNKIVVVPFGAFLLFSGRHEVSTSVSRQRLGIAEDKKVLLFFGGLRRNKGLDILLDAFDSLKSNVKDAFLVVAGPGGGRGPSEYYDNLFRRLRENERIKFVHQYVPTEEMADYFAAADVVVLPYRKTYQSGVLLAAYGFGKPVVVTDTGGLAEVVEHGRSGLVVPTIDPAALAQAIEEILRDPEKQEAMAQAAKRLGETKYSWKTAAVRTVEVYRSMTDAAGSEPLPGQESIQGKSTVVSSAARANTSDLR